MAKRPSLSSRGTVAVLSAPDARRYPAARQAILGLKCALRDIVDGYRGFLYLQPLPSGSLIPIEVSRVAGCRGASSSTVSSMPPVAIRADKGARGASRPQPPL